MSTTGIKRLAARAIIVAGVGLGLAFGGAATANAEDYWDVDQFDRCRAVRGDSSTSEFTCCRPTGGVWTGSNAGEGKCVAPPAVQENASGPVSTSTPRPRPPLVPGESVAP
jgi:hypothetical protein